MQTTVQRHNTCLGWFFGVFGSLLLLFALSYIIDLWRLADARQQADALAASLGNSPAHHLISKVTRDISLLPVQANCEVQVYFTTPLGPEEFAARLGQVAGPLWGGNLEDGRNMYLQLPFIVDGSNTKRLPRDQIDTLPLIGVKDWYVGEDIFSSRVHVFYAEFSQANATIEYAGQPITENVAYVKVDAGRFPIWIWLSSCPAL